MSKGFGRVFITGGSGFVGGRMTALLSDRGVPVRALARSPAAAAKVAAHGAQPALGGLDDAAILSRQLDGCQTVFHVAGHVRAWDSYAAYKASNVDATQVLLEASRTAGVKTFVEVGAAAVVLGEPEALIDADERLPLRAPRWGPYMATKCQAERLVLEANGPHMRTSVVRPPLVWGNGMPMLDGLAKAARTGKFMLVDDGVHPMSKCHVDNVCHGAFLAAERGVGGEAYFLADAEESTLRRVTTALLATRGLDPGRKTIAFRTAWRLCSLIEPLWRTVDGYRHELPMTRQLLRMAAQPFTVNTAKARTQLGYQPVVSWEAGLRAFTAVG